MENLDDLREYWEDKRVLITGGCGFVGSHLANQLLQLGADITVFDFKLKNMPPGIKAIKGDIRSLNDINEATKDKDIVFHFAALLGVERIQNKPLEVLDVNLGGTSNALEAARRNKVNRLIYSSSSEVYGEPVRIPISEEDPTAPISVYGVSKLAGEAYCEAYRLKFGLETTCLRYFNVYGPGQNEWFVIPIFVSRVAKNQPPIVYGEGTQVRTYSYIEDIVRGTIAVATSEKGIGEVFNLGSSEPIAINDLANLVISLFGKDMKPIYKSFGDGIRVEKRDVRARVPDISKARRLLGYEQSISLKEGIKRFIEWYMRA